MSDEIKKTEPVNVLEEKQIEEKDLEQVAGGTAVPRLYQAVTTGKHIAKATLEVE